MITKKQFPSPCGEFGNAASRAVATAFPVFKFQSPCGEFGNAALSSSTRMVTGLVGLFWKTSLLFKVQTGFPLSTALHH